MCSLHKGNVSISQAQVSPLLSEIPSAHWQASKLPGLVGKYSNTVIQNMLMKLTRCSHHVTHPVFLCGN